MVDIPEFKRDESLDYLKVLKALTEIPFPVGRNLLVDFLHGKYNNSSITKNNLDELISFGTLTHWSKEEILSIIDTFMNKKMIEQVSLNGNSFAKVLKITLKGQNELVSPTLNKPPEPAMEVVKTEISDWDEKVFNEYSDFLVGLNDEQKKAVVSPSKNILTIAGAGTGKTSVIVRRIEFLIKKRGVNPEEILAITFTRKARKEMQDRLRNKGVEGVNVSTFNSFCENILRKYNSEIYGRRMRVLSYPDKMLALNLALYHHNLEIDYVLDKYFSRSQQRNKTRQQLHNTFLNDCFNVIDFIRMSGSSFYDFSKNVDEEHREMAEIVYRIISYLVEYKRTQGLRSFADQVVDVISAFKKNPAIIPYFDHVLVDEYQDVNNLQVDLLKLINHDHLFAVGDPRQSIYGWRGSDMRFIMNFDEDFGESEVIHLTKNYRSCSNIVDFINLSIKHMGLPDLRSNMSDVGDLKLFSFETEQAEWQFVCEAAIKFIEKGEDVFILSRTNRQANEVAGLLSRKGVPYRLKTDDSGGKNEASDDSFVGLTLATVHAIKGLEAKNVFLVGANKDAFPCRASDHPIIELLKSESYDKLEEEKRLFYVALSRARKNIYISYSGSLSDFVDSKMESVLEG